MKDQIGEVIGKVRQLLLKHGELDAASLGKLIDVNSVTVEQVLDRMVSENGIVTRTNRSKTVIRLRKRRDMRHASASLRRKPSRFIMDWKQRCFLD